MLPSNHRFETAFQESRNPDTAERSSLRVREFLHHNDDDSRLPKPRDTEAVSPRKRLKEQTRLMHKNPAEQRSLSRGTGV